MRQVCCTEIRRSLLKSQESTCARISWPSSMPLFESHQGDPRTFPKHYLPHLDTDIEGLYRGLKPQSAIMRAATGFGRTINTRRRGTRRLTTEQKVSIKQTGELRQLIWQRDDLKRSLYGLRKDRKGTRQYKKLQELSRKVTNTRQHSRHALQTKAWKDFDHNQAVLNVE
jgi:hypothetical protein